MEISRLSIGQQIYSRANSRCQVSGAFCDCAFPALPCAFSVCQSFALYVVYTFHDPPPSAIPCVEESTLEISHLGNTDHIHPTFLFALTSRHAPAIERVVTIPTGPLTGHAEKPMQKAAIGAKKRTYSSHARWYDRNVYGTCDHIFMWMLASSAGMPERRYPRTGYTSLKRNILHVLSPVSQLSHACIGSHDVCWKVRCWTTWASTPDGYTAPTAGETLAWHHMCSVSCNTFVELQVVCRWRNPKLSQPALVKFSMQKPTICMLLSMQKDNGAGRRGAVEDDAC